MEAREKQARHVPSGDPRSDFRINRKDSKPVSLTLSTGAEDGRKVQKINNNGRVSEVSITNQTCSFITCAGKHAIYQFCLSNQTTTSELRPSISVNRTGCAGADRILCLMSV